LNPEEALLVSQQIEAGQEFGAVLERYWEGREAGLQPVRVFPKGSTEEAEKLGFKRIKAAMGCHES
jgi:hypothetical protein